MIPRVARFGPPSHRGDRQPRRNRGSDRHEHEPGFSRHRRAAPALPARRAQRRRSHERLLDYLYDEGATPGRHAAFAVEVARLADAGESRAESLLEDAGRKLAELARTAAKRSGATVAARAGSVLDRNERVRAAFERSCRGDELEVLPGTWDPVEGALRLALAAVDNP